MIQIKTTTILNGTRTITTEKANKYDLRIEALKDIKGAHVAWNILDYLFDYSCGQTNKGFKVIQTIRQHKTTKETVIMNFTY